MRDAVRDLLPIIGVIGFFQLFVLQKPFPDLGEMLSGVLMLVLGLTFFVRGLEMGLFPLGESLAYALVRKGNLFWLLAFAFAMGFSTTVAEPALIAIAGKAAEVASVAKLIGPGEAEKMTYATHLRYVVAFSVGIALLFGALRIVRGWPIHYLIIGGYCVVTLLTPFAPAEIIGVAYDSGGVTTSTVTVPLTAALGVGLASTIHGRNPMVDGFGLIAFASLTPIVFVMGYGLFLFGIQG
ncbi:MAG: DUF1538 domain-containing protein [Magnetococcales bacterium]|nr:DUF1538 domain-containing protein [Magnetococcales bacterium]